MAVIRDSVRMSPGETRYTVTADGDTFVVWVCAYPKRPGAEVEGWRLYISSATGLSPDIDAAEQDALQLVDQIRRTR